MFLFFNFFLDWSTIGCPLFHNVVLIEGTVRTAQDFGFGYNYDMLIEEVKSKGKYCLTRIQNIDKIES